MPANDKRETPRGTEVAPDTASTYERAHPENEAGMGRLDNNVATPEPSKDNTPEAVVNKHPSRQINADDMVANHEPEVTPLNLGQPDHSMKEEEPLGWDQAPTDIHDPRHQRHSRVGGKGGTHDAGEPRHNG